MNLKQNYESYSQEDHDVWATLYQRQGKIVVQQASKEYKKGLNLLTLDPYKIPNLDLFNISLKETTGWTLVGVSGLLPTEIFFGYLIEKKFPITVSIRKRSELEFAELPDIFHDIYGHVPMLLTQIYSDFMVEYGRIALKYANNPTIVDSFARLYWFTLEMGLIKEEGIIKSYGGAILTSSNEIENISKPEVIKHPFQLEKVVNTPYDNLKLQKEYFLIESFDQLFDSLGEIENYIEKRVPQDYLQEQIF